MKLDFKSFKYSYMQTQDFTTSIEVEQSPMEVYNAINKVSSWWPGEFEGNSDKLNEEFIYRYQDMHYSKQKVVELVPGKKIVWLITDSLLDFVENKTEWTGTKVIFDISNVNGKTKIQFTHEGLIPKFQCYKDCHNAWTAIIGKSLQTFIATGKAWQMQEELVFD